MENLIELVKKVDKKMDEILISTSKFYGNYYSRYLEGFFNEGDLITIYSHYSYRLFTIGKDKRIFRVNNSDFGTIFFNKEEWRNKKINSIL